MEETRSLRITLQTLQPSATAKGLVGSQGLVSNSNLKDAANLTKPRHKAQPAMPSKIAIFEDKPNECEVKKSKVEDKGVQTETDAHLLTGEQITIEYWSTVAERRRLALTEALQENEELHNEVDNIRTELESLKAENGLLKPLAEEAQYLAEVLKDLVGESNNVSSYQQEDAKSTGLEEPV